jgi:hypothetical protein
MTPEAFNKRSMRKYDWGRGDIGLPEGASWEAVTERVKRIQRGWNADGGDRLKVDGKIGRVSIRRLNADKALVEDDSKGKLLIGGSIVPVDFNAVMVSPNSEYSLIGHHDYKPRTHMPSQVIWHWDATTSAKTCHRILSKRGVSSHGCIDNDGTFYQFLDLENTSAWHAGNSRVNRASIGIDISNAVYTKYNPYYEKRWGARPVINATVNGHTYELLGYYGAQLRTARALAAFLNEHMDIPLDTPEKARTFSRPHEYRGHLAHYHVKKTKWDVAGWDFDYMLGKTDEISQGD